MRLTPTRPFKTMKDYVVPICLTVFNVLFLGLISWIVKVKAKSDKADVKKIVKEELKDTHKDITWVKEAIHDIQLYNQLSAEKSKNTRRNIQETLEAQVEDFKDFMKLYAADQRRERSKASVSDSRIGDGVEVAFLGGGK